ncbi:MAG: UDP-N-acetylmuramoyl-L-alanine--D-glutamate ligase [Bacteroidales bacterium]
MKRIVILGGGESGVGAAILAKVKGFEVFLSDKNNISVKSKSLLMSYKIDYEEGGHTKDKIFSADEVIKSPGIPDSIDIIQEILSRNIPIISEIEFAGRYDKAKKICITGSNGKTTTTSLIYYLLKNAGLNVGLAGNIGESYAYQVATENFDIYVLELSSFQLDGMYDFKADIAIILNITPDHLDRYNFKMENYVKAKFRITRNMSSEDCFIFCQDDEVTLNHLSNIVLRAKKLPFTQIEKLEQGADLEDETIKVKYEEDEFDILAKDLSLSGKHNIYNSMAAAITARVMNIKNSVIRDSLMSFSGIEHRMEKVLEVKQVLYINDSKATNVNSTWYALESIDRPIIWIAGGTDKGNDYSALYELVEKKVKHLICLGIDNEKLHKSFEGKVDSISDVKSAKAAVKKAYELAEKNDVVLLSPCCASFDLFKNYEERGDLFKEAVRKL